MNTVVSCYKITSINELTNKKECNYTCLISTIKYLLLKYYVLIINNNNYLRTNIMTSIS